MSRAAALTFVALTAISVTARSQSGGGIIDYETLTKAAVGSWADYTMTFKQQAEIKRSRWTVVERTPQRLVLENEIGMTIGPGVFRMEYERVGSDGWKITGGTVKLGSAAPTALPADKLGPTTLVSKGTPLGKLVGREKVETPAGTFDCRHFVKTTRMAQSDVVVDVWVSPKAAPTGMVKSVVASRGIEVVLSAVGRGGAPTSK